MKLWRFSKKSKEAIKPPSAPVDSYQPVDLTHNPMYFRRHAVRALCAWLMDRHDECDDQYHPLCGPQGHKRDGSGTGETMLIAKANPVSWIFSTDRSTVMIGRDGRWEPYMTFETPRTPLELPKDGAWNQQIVYSDPSIAGSIALHLYRGEYPDFIRQRFESDDDFALDPWDGVRLLELYKIQAGRGLIIPTIPQSDSTNYDALYGELSESWTGRTLEDFEVIYTTATADAQPVHCRHEYYDLEKSDYGDLVSINEHGLWELPQYNALQVNDEWWIAETTSKGAAAKVAALDLASSPTHLQATKNAGISALDK